VSEFAESVEAFGEMLSRLPVRYDPRYVAEDLASLRQVFPSGRAFADALLAIAKAAVIAVRRRDGYGVALDFQLAGWRRAAVPASPNRGATADLRIVFRPTDDGNIELLAFGHRRQPHAVYFAAKRRT